MKGMDVGVRCGNHNGPNPGSRSSVWSIAWQQAPASSCSWWCYIDTLLYWSIAWQATLLLVLYWYAALQSLHWYASSACGAILIYCMVVSPARCYIETVHGISELCWYTAWYYVGLLRGKPLLLLRGVMLIWKPLPVMVQYWSIAWQCCLLIRAAS